MGRYEGLKQLDAFRELTPTPEDRVARQRSSLPSMPEDYADFLLEVGFGAVKKPDLMLYSGLVRPGDLFSPEDASTLSALRLFGDDFQGYSFGFDTAGGWSVVEVDSSDMSLQTVATSFEEFIRRWVESDD